MDKLFIGLDFSINKPAMTILYNGEYSFFAWPLSLSKKHLDIFRNSGINIISRDLCELKKKEYTSSKLTLEHTTRSIQLADMIKETISDFMLSNNIDNNAIIYIASEGLSFGSHGNATLDLATYKGVLLATLYKEFKDNIHGLFTYSPISLKSTAHCATKDKVKDKNAMIDAFIENFPYEHKFIDDLRLGLYSTTKNYSKCTDDIVDSYYAL
jgi:hypothetical protein